MNDSQDNLRNIDGIERAKIAFYEMNGQHLSVKLFARRIQLDITDEPKWPKMLPLAKPSRLKKAVNKAKTIRIKVRKG